MTKNNKLIILSGFVCFVFLFFQAINPLIVSAITTCSGGNCWYTACRTNSDCGTNQFTGVQQCDGNSIYQDYMTFTCNSPNTADASCTRSITSRHQKSCDSDQTCRYGVCFENDKISNISNINNTYVYQSRKQCIGNSVYWFDSNGNQQGLYQTCGYNQTCSNNSCVTLSCVSHAIKGCLNNSVFWYDSCGTQQDLYQNCSSTNQVCQNSACIATSRPSYTQPSPIVTTTYVVKNENLIISIFGQKETDSLQWSKNVNALNNDKINFLITIKNTYNEPIDNVLVKTDITNNITYSNDLKIDNIAYDGNVISGINLGKIPPNASKIITFAGFVRSGDYQGLVKVTGTVNSEDISDSDSFTINIEKSSAATAALGNSPIINFVKKWYIWAIIIVVLVSLFIIIFKRLSSKV